MNGQHAFGRAEGHRYDPDLARQCLIRAGYSTAGVGRATRKWPLTVDRSRPVIEQQTKTCVRRWRVVAH